MQTSKGICQSATESKISVNRWHVLKLIEDAEMRDNYKRELDTLASLYVEQYKKSAMQDTIIGQMRANLSICQRGWEEAETIISLQKKQIDDMKYKHRRRMNIAKGIILGLATAIIVK